MRQKKKRKKNKHEKETRYSGLLNMITSFGMVGVVIVGILKRDEGDPRGEKQTRKP